MLNRQNKDQSIDESSGGENFIPTGPRKNKRIQPMKKPSKKIDLKSLTITKDHIIEGRTRSTSANDQLVSGNTILQKHSKIILWDLNNIFN